MRLADLDGSYQEKAANLMDISRQTFGRIIESAHKKIADAIINGKALKIEGGEVTFNAKNTHTCPRCDKTFNQSKHLEKNKICPRCAGKKSKRKN